MNGGGSCLPPVSFSYAGHAGSYAFDEICDKASYIRALVLAIAAFCSAVIVVGAKF
jgi:hypothetical protein